MKYIKTSFLVVLSLMVFGFLSCDDDNPMPRSDKDDSGELPSEFRGGLFVLNEGNFQWNNAGISFVDLTHRTVITDVFSKVNNSLLGDVAVNMYYYDGKYFVVVNNSARITVIDAHNFEVLHHITGFVSPRCMAFDGDYAYVSDLYANGVYVVDLKSKAILKKIQLTGWTENLTIGSGRLFVSVIGEASKPNSERHSFVGVIDLNSDSLIQTIDVPKEPLGAEMDKNGHLWVLCSGGYDDFEVPAFVCINTQTLNVERKISFPNISSNPGRMKMNSTNDTIFYIDGGLWKLPIDAQAVESNPLIGRGKHLFYGLGVDIVNQTITLTDAVDYVQDGWVYNYTKYGVKLDSFRVGRIPCGAIVGQ